MDFSYSEKVRDLQLKVGAFMDEHIYPAERLFDAEVDKNRRDGNPWQTSEVMEDLKRKARAQHLWNLFLPESAWRDRIDASSLADWCRQNMAAYKAPRIIAFVDALPKSGAGKIQWRELQERETPANSAPPGGES